MKNVMKKKRNLIAIGQRAACRAWTTEFIFHLVNSHLIIFLFDGARREICITWERGARSRNLDALIGYTRKRSRRAPVESKLNSASHISERKEVVVTPVWRSRGSVELPWYIYIYDTRRIAIRCERRRKGTESDTSIWNVYVVVDCKNWMEERRITL